MAACRRGGARAGVMCVDMEGKQERSEGEEDKNRLKASE